MVERERGLKSITAAREDRAKHGKFGRPTGTFAVLAALGILAVLGANYLWTNHKLDEQREAILSQQRAAVSTLGAEWFPLRDRLESWVMTNALEYPGDKITDDAQKWDFRGMPGIYLRIRQNDAKDPKELRKAGGESRRDGFTACLLKTQTAEDVDAGPTEDRPWNLRQAYMATRVLTDDWVHEVKIADDDLRLRVFDEQYEKAKKEEIPLAIDIVKRAQFFLFVLDEDVPEARAQADGGAVTIEDVQLFPHPSRVVLYNLKTNQLEFRVRRTSQGRFLMAGDNHNLPQETRDALVRQVNNCSLAGDVKHLLNQK